MAPRSRARAALQANIVVPAVKVTELPEAVLATCLAHLDLKQRCAPGPALLRCGRQIMCGANASPTALDAQGSTRPLPPAPLRIPLPLRHMHHILLSHFCRLGPVSLACKRFAAAALSPELLREMDVELMSLPAVRSFAAFLARHGQQLQRLKLHCDDETEEGGAAAAAAVTACLSFAGAGRQLVELRVSGRICSTEWLVAMPLLRRLELQSWDEGSRLHVSSAIRSLSALSVLQLSGNLSFPAGKRLPPSLKWLSLESDGSAALPKQASGDVLTAHNEQACSCGGTACTMWRLLSARTCAALCTRVTAGGPAAAAVQPEFAQLRLLTSQPGCAVAPQRPPHPPGD